MDPIKIEIHTEAAGELIWTFPPGLQKLFSTYPPELQERLLELARLHLEAFARTLHANITSGSTAEVLFEILNNAMAAAGEISINVLRGVESGVLPPCGNPACAAEHN